MVRFCKELVSAWSEFESWGHPIEVGHSFMQVCLARSAASDSTTAATPRIACRCWRRWSAFPHSTSRCTTPTECCTTCDVYDTYNRDWMNRDLVVVPGAGRRTRTSISADCIRKISSRSRRPTRLPAWHLVGGLDPLDDSDAPTASTSTIGLPVALGDWIDRDGLFCLKIKLRGNDAAWDYERIVRVGQIALREGVQALVGRLQLHRHRAGIRE